MAGLDHDILKLQPDWLDSERPRLGRYVLGPLLGRGGMGEVVEAWDVVLCRTVALKVLKNLEATAVIRFMHEAQIQARIVHPNICRIYDVDASEGNVKIAMQLVRGPNLEQAARDLSITEVVSLMAQVAEAIHAAHRLKLIHRDLKPSNILLERGEDGRWFPYICDFGLAMAMDEPSLTYTN
jgi:serine/threonine-protein kinase